jgi:hypothetical protein
MESVPADEFMRWAASVGIGFHPGYPDSKCLSLLPPGDHARFWVLPFEPATWPHFIASLVDGLDDWETGYLWPRAGRWPTPAQGLGLNDGVRMVLLRGAGIPFGSAAAVRFDRDTEGELFAVLYAYLAFGWCTDDDLFFVPDHGRQLLQTDHHDVVHIKCRTEERVLELVEHMSKMEYELPKEPPDWTFKRPAWMGGSDSRSAPTN